MHRHRSVVIAAAVSLILIDVVSVFTLPPHAQTVFVDAFESALGLLGVICCGVAVVRSKHFGRGAWGLVALFFLSLALADIEDLYLDLLPTAGWPAWIDPFGWWFYSIPLALLIFLPSTEERRPWQIQQAVLDLLQVAIVITVAYFYFIYLPYATAGVWVKQWYPKNLRDGIIAAGLLLRAGTDPSAEARIFFRRVGVVVAGICVLRSLHVALGFPSIPFYPVGRPALLILLAVSALAWPPQFLPASVAEKAYSKRPSQVLLSLLPVLGPMLVLPITMKLQLSHPLVAHAAIWTSLIIFILRMALIEHRQQQDARSLAIASNRFRQFFFNNPLPMWVFDRESLRFLEVNDAAVQHYGYSREEFLSMQITQIRPEEEVPVILKSLEPPNFKPRRHLTVRHKLKDGKVIQCEVDRQTIDYGGRTAELVIAIDVTERKQLEDQLRQAQKMEAIGTLAGGIAHDFNNLLTVVSGYARLARIEKRDEERLNSNLVEIEKAVDHGAALSGQLLAFSHRQVLQPRVLDLNTVVDSMRVMLQRVTSEKIRITTSLAPDLRPIKADRGQLEQVIMNLAVNACDAMPEGGTLHFVTNNVSLNDKRPCQLEHAQPGNYVILAVTDSGCGMSAEMQSHIFEPFFTTKGLGKGTGLGLSTVYGIVRQSGGLIQVESEVGKGSSFVLYLPQTEEAEEAVLQKAKGKMHGPRGRETILVVEDHDSLRVLMGSVLQMNGYNVIMAENAEKAQTIDRDFEGKIDLLLTDVAMPGLDGPGLAARLLKVRPGLRLIYISGYTDDPDLRERVFARNVPFLQKPFDPPVLLQRVREVLDAPPQRFAA